MSSWYTLESRRTSRDGPQQVLVPEGLGDVGGGAGAVGLHHVRQLRPRGEEDDRDVLGVAELELAAHLVAVHARHGDVEEDEVRVAGEGELETLLAAGRGEHLVAARRRGRRRPMPSGPHRRRSPVCGVSRPATLLPPRAGLRARQISSCARAQVLSARPTERIRRVLRDAAAAGTLAREPRARRGDGHEGIRPGRRNDSAARRRSDHVPAVPHVTQYRRRRRRGRRPALRHRSRRAHGRPLRAPCRPRGLAHHPPGLQPGAARGRLRAALRGRRRRRARGRRRFHRPQPRGHGGHAARRCTPPAACLSASAATTRSPSPSCAPRRARFGPLALVHFGAHTDCLEESAGQRHIHDTVVRRAVEEGVVDRDLLRPPRHARRPRLAGRVRAGARARLHRGAVGRPRPARHRRGGRGGRGDRRAQGVHQCRRRLRGPGLRPGCRHAGGRAARARPRRSRSSAAAAVSTSPAPTSSRSCPSSTAATSRRRSPPPSRTSCCR